MTKRALITGVTGQDGSYLAELLLSKGYAVTGVVRQTEDGNNIDAIKGLINVVTGEIVDRFFVRELVAMQFDEIYHLASIATVASPWENPVLVQAVTGNAPVYFMEAIRSLAPKTKFFQASSAEMFAAVTESPQNEETRFAPQNPYGAAKLYAHTMLEGYRRSFGLFFVSGILFNHESPKRPTSFVVRKVTSTLTRIQNGADEVLELGNLDAMRDWGYAGDYVRAMWMSLQHDVPDTYVIATGEAHSVRELVEVVAEILGINLEWRGTGLDEVGVDVTTGKTIIKINEKFYRPVESNVRRGSIAKISREVGWRPEMSFKDMVRMMVNADRKALGLPPASVEAMLELPGSVAELVDRITILRIKGERVADPTQLNNIHKELALLETALRTLPQSSELDVLTRALKEANESIWDAEEMLRVFWNDDAKVLLYARESHTKRDERAHLKQGINALVGSPLPEIKSHQN